MASYAARGLTLRYEQAGDGRPVVLLAGMSNHCRAWAPQLDALAAAGWRAVLPDLAGHGRSDPVSGRHHHRRTWPATWSACSTSWRWRPRPSAGCRLGGLVAQQLLVDHAERVTGALVVSAGTNLTFPGAEQVIASLRRPSGWPPTAPASGWRPPGRA